MDYKEYYTNQIGSGLPVYYGSRYQKGYGLGNMFRSFFRWIVPVFKTHALPLLKEGAKTLGNEAIRTAANVATDTLSGKDIEHAARERAQEAFDNLKNKARGVLQIGDGYKKRKTKVKMFSYKKPNKRKQRDIFD